MSKLYMKGNEAIVEGALKAGVEGFLGYPITPASEIIETFAQRYFADREREKSFFLKELFSVKEERSELRNAGERALLDSPSSK